MTTINTAKPKKGSGVDFDKAWREYLDDNPEKHKSLANLLIPKTSSVTKIRPPRIGFSLPDNKTQ